MNIEHQSNTEEYHIRGVSIKNPDNDEILRIVRNAVDTEGIEVFCVKRDIRTKVGTSNIMFSSEATDQNNWYLQLTGLVGAMIGDPTESVIVTVVKR